MKQSARGGMILYGKVARQKIFTLGSGLGNVANRKSDFIGSLDAS